MNVTVDHQKMPVDARAIKSTPSDVARCAALLQHKYPHTYRKISPYINSGDRLTYEEYNYVIVTWCDVSGPDIHSKNPYWKNKIFCFLGISEEPECVDTVPLVKNTEASTKNKSTFVIRQKSKRGGLS